MCSHIQFLEMVRGTSIPLDRSIPNIHYKPNKHRLVEFVEDEIMRISEESMENLNLLREEVFSMVTE